MKMKGAEKSRQWMVGGTRKEEKGLRGRRKERIPPGSEPVGLNNGST